MKRTFGFARVSRSRSPAFQRVFALSAVILGLGLVLYAIGVLRAPLSEQMAGQSSVEAVQLAAGVVPAVGGSQRVAAVGFAVPMDVDWKKTDHIKTVDPGPGGTLQWHPETGRVRTCDTEQDNHSVHGYVIKNGHQVASMRAGHSGACDEPDSGYKLAKGFKYEFKVCLATSKGEGYCNTSNTEKWPQADRKEDYCEDNFEGQELIKCQGGDSYCDDIKGPAKQYCERGTGYPGVDCDSLKGIDRAECRSAQGLAPEYPNMFPPPEGGRRKTISELPDETLKLRGHGDAENAERLWEVASPLRVLNDWLVWFALGACMLGFMLVGGNMALKHKRGEAGAHAAGLSWVMIACVVASSGLVMGLISLLIDPL